MSTPAVHPAPTPRVVMVDGVPMSGLFARVPEPRATIVAIHGGATTSAYFDCPGHPRLSLLRLGAQLGFSVLALDRPGFGSSALYADEFADTARRVEMTYGAVDKILGERERGAGLFLLGHSAGCELALRMAVEPRGTDVLGIEISGTGLHQQAAALAMLSSASLERPPTGLRELLWQPAHLYPDDIAKSVRIRGGPPGARYETKVITTWTNTLPELAARVDIPVRYTLAEYERVWQNGPDALAEVAALFTTSPRVLTNQQDNGGHNLSLGHIAAAYHLSALAFAEECAVGRKTATSATTDYNVEAS